MDAILSFLKEFEVSKLLPEIDGFMVWLSWITRLAVLIGPLVLLCLGLLCHYRPTQEPSRTRGIRSQAAMGSVEAWKFAQQFAGVLWMAVGGGMAFLMLLLSIFCGFMGAIGMVVAALVCILIELGLVIACQVLINKQVLKYFDKAGNRR